MDKSNSPGKKPKGAPIPSPDEKSKSASGKKTNAPSGKGPAPSKTNVGKPGSARPPSGKKPKGAPSPGEKSKSASGKKTNAPSSKGPAPSKTNVGKPGSARPPSGKGPAPSKTNVGKPSSARPPSGKGPAPSKTNVGKPGSARPPSATPSSASVGGKSASGKKNKPTSIRPGDAATLSAAYTLSKSNASDKSSSSGKKKQPKVKGPSMMASKVKAGGKSGGKINQPKVKGNPSTANMASKTNFSGPSAASMASKTNFGGASSASMAGGASSASLASGAQASSTSLGGEISNFRKNYNSPMGKDEYADYVEQYMIYYLLGNIYLRPVAFVSGFLSQQLETGLPYPLRRSSGRIQLVPYEPSNESMSHDYNHVTEKGVASVSSNHLAINILHDAKLAVFGEISSGYIFEAPTSIASTGHLYIAYWSKGELAEELLKCGAVVNIISGVAKLYVCDLKHFVLVYDNETKFTIGLIVSPDGKNEAKAAAAVLDRVKATKPA